MRGSRWVRRGEEGEEGTMRGRAVKCDREAVILTCSKTQSWLLTWSTRSVGPSSEVGRGSQEKGFDSEEDLFSLVVA